MFRYQASQRFIGDGRRLDTRLPSALNLTLDFTDQGLLALFRSPNTVIYRLDVGLETLQGFRWRKVQLAANPAES